MSHEHASSEPETVAEEQTGGGRRPSPCSESSTIDEILAGNALFFLLDLRPLYDYINASTAPREVRECLKRINLAAASIQGALGNEGYARAKARDEKIKSDLAAFLSQNDEWWHRRDQAPIQLETLSPVATHGLFAFGNFVSITS